MLKMLPRKKMQTAEKRTIPHKIRQSVSISSYFSFWSKLITVPMNMGIARLASSPPRRKRIPKKILHFYCESRDMMNLFEAAFCSFVLPVFSTFFSFSLVKVLLSKPSASFITLSRSFTAASSF